MEFGLVVFWLAFAIAVGMFAGIRRNRFGFGWFLLALIISPLLAGIFVAILKEGETDKDPQLDPQLDRFLTACLVIVGLPTAMAIIAVLVRH
jgi:disulfide bond formation protein DsbB